MLGIIQQHLGGQPFNIVCAVADEILALIQNPSKKDKDKLLNLIPNYVFDRLVAIGKLITHFQDATCSDDHQYHDLAVAVQFEENEDDDLDMVKEEEEDEEEDDDLDHDAVAMLQMGGGTGGIDDHDLRMSLNVQDIDAYWLQRKISQHIIDPQQCHTLAEEILKKLEEGDDKEVESKLPSWAQDQQQKNKIEEEMLNLDPNLAAILQQLRPTKANAKDRENYLENSIREEARRLKDESVNTDLQSQRQLLDLDSLAFVQPNNKFDLPMRHYSGKIIITTPEKWDALSRRWKQRKYVQQISLFITDELHLIGGQGGPVLEVIVSRMRYIASLQVENKIRLVALSTSLANAKDLGEWIGATSSHGLFNFPPGVRPVPLEIHIQGVDIANFDARMQAMTKQTHTAIVQHAKKEKEKPAIVFVPSRKYVRLTAVDLMTYSSPESDKQPPPFLLHSAEELEPFISKIQEEMLRETLLHGVGYLHEGLSSLDQEVVTQLFEVGWIKVCVTTSSMCWGLPLTAHLVVVMGTQYYDEQENAQTDYAFTDLLQMMGHASRPLLDNSGKCVILCHTPRKEYYKKFLYEAIPVESHLHHFLHDNFNAEVVAGVIVNKQDAVDYLTWTFMYRRLTQNPNYYNLQGVSHSHLSDHLSELVENTLSDLEASKCITIEHDVGISPSNLGRIASYYYISYTTIERFSSSLIPKTKMKGLLEILASASEYEQLPIRPGEEEVTHRLINHQRFSFENPRCTYPHVKANALLQAHFSRQRVGGSVALDQQEVVLSACRLLQAMVDVISSNGWLNLALLAMEVSQMVTQGLWECDSMLLQLPHMTKELAKRCQENPGKSIVTVFDLMEMEDDERQELLQMSDTQLLDIARFCNRFPNIDMSYEVRDDENVSAGENITLLVILESDLEEKTEVGPVSASSYPKAKEEGWWLVVGDTEYKSIACHRESVPSKEV